MKFLTRLVMISMPLLLLQAGCSSEEPPPPLPKKPKVVMRITKPEPPKPPVAEVEKEAPPREAKPEEKPPDIEKSPETGAMGASVQDSGPAEVPELKVEEAKVAAVQAVEQVRSPTIRLSAKLDSGGRVNIQVRDNGPGILDEVLEKIFIPFFTTKRTGSGIGLSLSRQIMRLHGGTISVNSRPNKGASFVLRF